MSYSKDIIHHLTVVNSIYMDIITSTSVLLSHDYFNKLTLNLVTEHNTNLFFYSSGSLKPKISFTGIKVLAG